MIDPFYECKDSNASSYADDTTPYSCATEIPSLESELQPSATKLSRWSKKKHFKANPGKSHVLLSTKKPEIISSNGIPFAASSHKRLLGVTTDSVLKFENYITKICLKVRIKLNTFCCISSSCH